MKINNTDIVNKSYNSCGCIYISQLNILDNIMHDQYIQLCKNHYLQSKDKVNYKFDKKNKLYTLNEKRSDSLKKKKISYNNSYENLKQLINDNSYENNLFSNKIIKFGKYKNKTYEYVYNIDKIYCYHLAYWKDTNLNNSNINNFINYIKLQVQ
jgi:hypothetical protein